MNRIVAALSLIYLYKCEKNAKSKWREGDTARVSSDKRPYCQFRMVDEVSDRQEFPLKAYLAMVGVFRAAVKEGRTVSSDIY